MASNLTVVDCTCPVCCDIFRDPVVLLCGHSFCKVCLQEWWTQSGNQTCPVCKELFPMRQPPRNLALKNLSDTLREEGQRASAGSKELCSLHSEKLKLFCQDDQQPICVICKDAKKHKKHNCIPINEAAEEHKTNLKVAVMHLRSKLGEFNEEKINCDKMASHIKFQAQKTEKTIKDEFQKLYQFLRAEEAARIDALRKEAILKSDKMKMRIVNLDAEISSLKDQIKVVEEEMKAGDILFMLNIKSIMERSQCKLPQPETPAGALIDEAKHLGNLLFTVWNKMKGIIQYTPVILDPNTGSKLLTISEGLTRATKSERDLQLPENPERCYSLAVLGSEGFSSGIHSWEVEVDGYWAVGVAARTRRYTCEKRWGIHVSVCSEHLHEITPGNDSKLISEDSFPKKIRVQLDYDQGMLSFVDLDRKTHVHTIRYTFTETVFPYFRENVKILPAGLPLRIRK